MKTRKAIYGAVAMKIVKLLKAVRHLCNEERIDFKALSRIAEQHYRAERLSLKFKAKGSRL